jgi:hypothetical protein
MLCISSAHIGNSKMTSSVQFTNSLDTVNSVQRSSDNFIITPSMLPCPKVTFVRSLQIKYFTGGV